jgi:hypothetical protein
MRRVPICYSRLYVSTSQQPEKIWPNGEVQKNLKSHFDFDLISALNKPEIPNFKER